MNIFWLSLNLKLCAQYHCDKHVVKMILEYAQMLSTAHLVLDGEKELRYNSKGKLLIPKYSHTEPNLYKATHINHPCSKWVRETRTNYEILYKLFRLLCKEYTRRYGKVHKTETKLLDFLAISPTNIKEGPMTNPPIAITDKKIKVRSSEKDKYYLIRSYRNYYNVEKRSFAKWTNREEPKWFLSFNI